MLAAGIGEATKMSALFIINGEGAKMTAPMYLQQIPCLLSLPYSTLLSVTVCCYGIRTVDCRNVCFFKLKNELRLCWFTGIKNHVALHKNSVGSAKTMTSYLNSSIFMHLRHSCHAFRKQVALHMHIWHAWIGDDRIVSRFPPFSAFVSCGGWPCEFFWAWAHIRNPNVLDYRLESICILTS